MAQLDMGEIGRYLGLALGAVTLPAVVSAIPQLMGYITQIPGIGYAVGAVTVADVLLATTGIYLVDSLIYNG